MSNASIARIVLLSQCVYNNYYSIFRNKLCLAIVSLPPTITATYNNSVLASVSSIHVAAVESLHYCAHQWRSPDVLYSARTWLYTAGVGVHDIDIPCGYKACVLEHVCRFTIQLFDEDDDYDTKRLHKTTLKLRGRSFSSKGMYIIRNVSWTVRYQSTQLPYD